MVLKPWRTMPAAVAVALEDRGGGGLDLVETHVRRDGRHGGIGHEVEDDGPIGGQRRLPRSDDVARLLDPDALQTHQAGEVGVGDVGDRLGGQELR